MAQFTVQGRLKPLFNGDGMSIAFEPNDPHHHPYYYQQHHPKRPIPLRSHSHKRKLRLQGSSSTGLFASSSSPSSSSSSKSYHFKASITVNNDGIGDEADEFEMDELSCFRGLVLDISYRPINVVCWKRAICLEFMEKADVLEYYAQTVNSPSGSFYIPAVLRVPHLLQVVKRRRVKNTLSRKNIFYRDNFTCQTCLPLSILRDPPDGGGLQLQDSLHMARIRKSSVVHSEVTWGAVCYGTLHTQFDIFLRT